MPFGRAADLTHRHVELTAFAQAPYQLQVDLSPTTDRLAVDRDDLLIDRHPGLRGEATRLHSPNHWTHLLTAEHGQEPEEHQSEKEIGQRTGRDDGEALPHRLAIERTVEQRWWHVTLALVEHLDVPAERDRGDHELGAVPIMPTHQRTAEADREAQHLDAATPCDPEVTEFVEGNQHPERNEGADDHVERAHNFPPGWVW